MSKRLKLETQQEVNISGQENVKDEDKADEVMGHSQHEEKSAESIVMSGTIPHVLERILSFLPVSNLKQCRQVSTDWNKAAVVQLRKDLPYFRFPPSSPWTWNDNLFRNNFDILLTLENKISPFVKFSITMSDMQLRVARRFFNTIAPSATHFDLHIVNDKYEDARFALDPTEIHFPMLTKLRQIVSSDVAPEGFQFNQKSKKVKFDRTLFGILEKSPKLQTLELELLGEHSSSSYVMNLFLSTLEKKNNANLRHLDIQCYIDHLDAYYVMTDSDFSRLSAMGLTLSSFRLNYNQDDLHFGTSRLALEYERGLLDFLTSQTETLECLEINPLEIFLHGLQFPPMKKLKTLIMIDCDRLRDSQARPSFNYGLLPSLKNLEILCFSKHAFFPFLPDSSLPPVQSVEYLLLLLTNPDDGISDEIEINLIHATQYFPNLKVLERIPVNLRIANSIYKWLPQLEELTFETGYTDSIDDIITGLSLERCAELRIMPINEIRDMSVDVDLEDPDSLRPLSSLKHLKTLRLVPRFIFNNQAVELSRVSTLLVLTKMSSLQTIDFGFRSSGHMRDLEDLVQQLEESGKSVICKPY